MNRYLLTTAGIPAASKARTTCAPIYPAPPVTRTFRFERVMDSLNGWS